MKIVDRYIFRELLVPFLLGIGVFTSILLIARILKLVEMVVNRGVPFLQIVKLFSYILPAFLELTVPMALLLAILVAFGRLSADSEVIALQASGVGFYRLGVPVAMFAVLMSAITLVLAVYVRPWGNSHLRSALYEIVKARASAGIKPNVFNDDFHGLVLYVDQIESPGNTLRGVLISDTRDSDMHNTVFARVGIVITSEETHSLTLRLLDGSIYSPALRRKGYQDTRFSTYDINLDLDLALASLKKRSRDVSELPVRELWGVIVAKEALGQAAREERVELHRRFAIAFACLVFAALGAPLGVRPARAVHYWGFSVSLALIFTYYLLLTLGQNLGERGRLPPGLAIWLPNLFLSTIAVVLIIRTSGGRIRRRGHVPSRWGTRLWAALSSRPSMRP